MSKNRWTSDKDFEDMLEISDFRDSMVEERKQPRRIHDRRNARSKPSLYDDDIPELDETPMLNLGRGRLIPRANIGQRRVGYTSDILLHAEQVTRDLREAGCIPITNAFLEQSIKDFQKKEKPYTSHEVSVETTQPTQQICKIPPAERPPPLYDIIRAATSNSLKRRWNKQQCTKMV